MLNLNLPWSGELTAFEGKPVEEGSGSGHMDDSGTSNSSVLNAEASVDVADEDSCSVQPAAVFEFGILKNSASAEDDNEVEEEMFEEDQRRSGLLTRQLFPPALVVPHVSQLPVVDSSSSSCRAHWMDLTFSQVDGPMELRVLHQQQQQQQLQQQQQQAKKSRRGPRSRSSQYRGVTFYRRTGRWESHIWLANWSFES
ncbi:hypothetical protein B296_00014737 [Ensete ventricosum]|uniref:AP2/ERF domain-containing protein n=1 Tax=Ensete ventricosum TaxID=4639 RepID=A0A427A3G8_ENSVE|nr:hypothetical protein B296_00014737 [Ensete ventricosum]